MAKTDDIFFPQVYSIVREIPISKIATYTQIAIIAGEPKWARNVGRALAALNNGNDAQGISVPWQRVVYKHSNNKYGKLKTSKPHTDKQLELLLCENVFVDKFHRIDLKRYGWKSE